MSFQGGELASDWRSASLAAILVGLRSEDREKSSECAGELIRRFTPMLRKVWLRGGFGEGYEDFVQEAFLRLFRYLPSLDDSALFPGYFHRIASSVFIDMHRRDPAWRLVSADLDEVSEELSDEEILAPLYVASFLDRLQEREHMVLRLLYLEDLTDKEVGTLLRLTPGAVRKIKSNGIKQLKAIVRGQLSGAQKTKDAK